MFVVVESGGLQSPYIPGRFRPRKVDPVQKVPPVDRAGPQSGQSESEHPHPGHSPFIQAYEAMNTMKQAGRSIILAEDVMSSPAVSLPSDASLTETQHLFRERRFRHVPVINDQGQVMGIVSDRDIWRRAADPALSQFSNAVDPALTTIVQCMSHPVLVADPDTEIRGIARVMLEEHVGAMPIVSQTGRLLGIITRSDILRMLISHPDFDHWV